MTVADEPHYESVDQMILAHDDLPHLIDDGGEQRRLFEDELVGGDRLMGCHGPRLQNRADRVHSRDSSMLRNRRPGRPTTVQTIVSPLLDTGQQLPSILGVRLQPRPYNSRYGPHHLNDRNF